MIKFVRRKCDVERYNRAIKVLSKVTFSSLMATLENEIKQFETKTKIIEFFCSNPNTKTESDKYSNDGKIHTLVVKTIGKKNGKYFVFDNMFVCRMVGENYVDKKLNIGKDYHSLSLKYTKGVEYWYCNYDEFLLEQLLNQDKLESMCDELNHMGENYFNI